MTHAAHGTQTMLEKLVSSFGRIAVFSVAAGLIVRGFFAITQAMRDTIAAGINFNATMEQSRIAIAAILTNTRNVADTQGRILSITEAYPRLLQEASKIQKDILLANIKTLGTGQELLEVYQLVLANTGQQVGNLDDVLRASQIILNISRMNSEAGEKAAVNARQAFTLETMKGNTVLRYLNTNINVARSLRDQGKWLQEILKRGEIFSLLSEQIGDSWEALVSTVSTFFSTVSGAAFSDVFEGLKVVIAALGKELLKIDQAGGLKAALNISESDLRALGQDLGGLTASFIRGMAEASAATIKFVSDTRGVWEWFSSSEAVGIISSFVATIIAGWKLIFEGWKLLWEQIAANATAIGTIATEMAKIFAAPFLAVAEVIATALQKALRFELISGEDIERISVDAVNSIKEAFLRIGQAGFQMEFVPPTLNEINTALTNTGKAAEEAAGGIKLLPKPLDDIDKAAEKAAKTMEGARKSLIAQTAALQIENEELAKAAKGLISLEEALLNAEERQNALKTGSEEAAKAFRDATEINKDYRDAIEEVNKFNEEAAKFEEDKIKSIQEAEKAINDEISALREQISIFESAAAGGRSFKQATHDAAVATEELALASKSVRGDIHAQAEEVVTLREQLDKAKDAAEAASNAFLISFTDIQDIFHEVVVGIARGTSDLGDIFKRQGQALGAQLITGILVGKSKLEGGIGTNFNTLLGLGPGGILGIFAQGGGLAGTSFIGGLLPSFGKIVQNIKLLLTGNASFMGSMQGIWDSLGGWSGAAFTAGLTSAILGSGPDIARAFSGVLGTAALIPGPQQPFVIGAALIASLFGGGFFNFLSAPGRIEIEKGAAEDFFQKVFEDINFSEFIEPKVADALETFEEFSPAMQALGTQWAQAFGDEATQGTIIRFAGQFLANLKNMGLTAEEVQAKVLELAEAMGFNLVSAVNEINNALTFHSDVQGNNLLSMEEFIEEVEEARRNLSKYGETANLTVAELEALALANGNTGSTIVTLNELYAGIIDLATGFSEEVDALAVANELLANRFTEVAQEGALFDDSISSLAEQVRSGVLSIEEAIVALNDMRVAAGMTQLELSEFTLDPERIMRELGVLEQVTTDMRGLGEMLGTTLIDGVEEALNPQEIGQVFADSFDEAIRGVLMQAIAAAMVDALNLAMLEPFFEKMRDLITDFVGGEISFKEFAAGSKAALADVQPEIDAIRKGLEFWAEMSEKFLMDLGIMPEKLEEVEEAVTEISENLEKWEKDIYNAIKTLDEFNSEFLKGADITTPLLEDTADLTEQMSTDVESAISQAISDALAAGDISLASDTLAQGIGTAIFNAITSAVFNALITVPLTAALAPFLAQLALATQIFMDSGMKALDEFLKEVDNIFAGILEVIPVFIDIINSEEWQAFLDELRSLTGAAPVATPVPATFTTPGGVPSTEQFNQELDNAEDAIEQFIESLDDTTNALQDLVDAYLELLQTIEESMPPEAVPPEQQPAQLAAILETLLGWMMLLVPAFEELGLDMEVLYAAIAAITKALEEFYLTGGFTEETLLELQAALQAVLDAIVENAGALQQWLMQMGYTANFISQIIGYLELAIDTINKMLGEDVPGLPDAQKAFIEEIQELVDEFVEAGKVTSDLSEEIEDLIDEYNTLKTTLIENEELIRATLEALGMSTELFDEWMVAIEESFIKQMEDLIDEIYEVDSVWEDLHDTLITSLTVAKALNDALKEGTITQEQYEKFMKQVLIETIRAVSNELQDLQEMADDLVESFDDFIESGEDVSDLQQDLNDLSDEYLQAVKDLRENFVLFILTGGNVREELAALQAAFEKQARAIGAALMEEIAGPAVEAIDEFNKKMAGTFDTFADLSDIAGAAIARFQEAFEAGDMEGAVELAEDAVNAQIAFIEKIDELRVAFEEFIESLDDDIQSLIDEGRTLEEQIADREAQIAAGFATFTGLSFEDQLVAAEDIRNAILEQFDLQKQLQQQILDDKIAELEVTRDANIEKINEEREAQRELLQTDLDSINERIRAHEDATARIAQIDEEIARLQIQIQQDELRTAIDIINERIRVVEDAEQTRLRLEEDTANELNRIREQTLDEQIRMAESFRDAAESIRAAIDDILLSEVSPLTPIQRLTEAQRQFAELVGLARGGDIEAARALGGAAQTLLGEASAVFASSTPFQDIFRETIKTMEELGLQFEQDAQLIELQIISDTLEDIEGAIILTGEETIEELIRMRDTLQDQLKALDKTPQQQIDALEEERRILVAGLEGNIEELINTRDTLQGELEDLDATFQLKIDEEMAAFDKAVDEQTDAFDLIIEELRKAAITELQLLKGYALDSKTALEDIERQALVNLNAMVLAIGTAIQTIVDEQIARTDLDEVFRWANEEGRQNLNIVFQWWSETFRQHMNELFQWKNDRDWDQTRYLASLYSRIGKNFQSGGFVPPGVTMSATLHGGARGEMVVPISSNGGRGGSVFEIDYERLGAVVAEAISSRGGPSQINIPIEVRTEDGEMLIRRTIKRLSDESPSGKIFIDARAVGKYRR